MSERLAAKPASDTAHGDQMPTLVVVRVALMGLALMGLAGCGSADVIDSGDENPFVLPELGKADNYISTNAREYELSGESFVALPSDFYDLDDEAKAARLKSLVESKTGTITRAIKSHIQDVLRPFNDGETGEKAKYFMYVKRNAGDHDNIQVTADGRASFEFHFELVSHVWLMSKVAPEAGARRTFDVEVKQWPEPTGETIEVLIEGSESRDAFPKYDELFADGVFDIAVHFGGDYNADRHDLGTARWLVDALLEGGFENASVRSFDDLAIDSPWFTRTLRVEGKPLEVRVKVVHSDMVQPDNEVALTTSMEESFKTADVVIYSGHAGENAGFILDYQPKHEIRASAFETLPMADKYQIFVLDGCRTYRTYVDDLMKNPAKSFDNVDIITTVNTTPFAVGYQVLWEFLYWFTLTDGNGNHFPLSWQAILRGVNTANYDDVHYGVHGIDNDPKVNPHGGAPACTPCQSDADCGAGGNLCLGYPGGAACGVACTTDSACPTGYRCARLTDDPNMFHLAKQCLKTDYVCEAPAL